MINKDLKSHSLHTKIFLRINLKLAVIIATLLVFWMSCIVLEFALWSAKPSRNTELS